MAKPVLYFVGLKVIGVWCSIIIGVVQINSVQTLSLKILIYIRVLLFIIIKGYIKLSYIVLSLKILMKRNNASEVRNKISYK